MTDQCLGPRRRKIEIAASGIRDVADAEHAEGRQRTRRHASTTPLLPAGTYVLRARARDQAGNEASTDSRGDGQPMVVTLPLRIADDPSRRDSRRTIRRQGKRRGRSIVLRPAARVGFGERVPIAGRLVTSDGRPIVGAPVQLLTTTGAEPEQLVETLTTDATAGSAPSTTGTQQPPASARLCRLVAGPAEPAHARDACAGRDLGPGQPASGAQRPGRRVQRPCARAAGAAPKASSSRSRCGSRIAGRPSGPPAAMRAGSGRAGIASNAHAACSATASASGFPRRAATRSRRAFPARSRSR